MREWIWRTKAMLRGDSLVAEKQEELQLHYDLEVENGVKRGLSSEESRRQARLKVGLVSEGVESTREEWGFRWLHGAVGDLRHAFRALTRNMAFSTIATVVLAAGVAIDAVIFCILDGVVLRPLPYEAPDQLVRLYDSGKTAPRFPMAIGRFLDYRANAKSLSGIALYTGVDMDWSSGDGRPEKLRGLAITSEYFSVLGKAPHLGRVFADSDLRTDVRNVVVSYGIWRDRLGSDPAILGKPIRLGRESWTIVGVGPKGFQHVGGDYRSPLQGETVDFWVPRATNVDEGTREGSHFCNAVARIRTGFTQAQAQQELTRLAALHTARYPQAGEWGIGIEPLLTEITRVTRSLIVLLVGAGALVMLIACANIGGLCLARAVARRKELALRHALGANGWRLVRVGLAECLLIGVVGAVAGALLASAALPMLRHLLPGDFPRAHEIELTWKAVVFAAATAVAVALAAGLVPIGATAAVQSHNRVSSGRDARRLRTFLVAGEVALAGLLCAGTIFLLRSYQEIDSRDHGFRPAGVLTFEVAAPRGSRTDREQSTRLLESVRLSLKNVPGVTLAGASTNLPWSGYDENTSIAIAGRTTKDADAANSARYQAASPEYHEATGMRLLAGRLFDAGRDVAGKPLTVVVNDALARRFLPGENAVGVVLKIWGEDRQIVGVVQGITDHPTDLEAQPAFWFPLGQVAFPSVSFAVRTSGADPASLTAALTKAVHVVDPELAVANVRTLERHASAALASRRFALSLFESFAVLALVLAAAGIYGLLAYIVHQRRKEFGIRAALGAGRASIRRVVLLDGLRMASGGALACLLLMPIAGRSLQAFLYNVGAYDLFTMTATPATLLVVSVLASLSPAWSAARNDPAIALRED